MKDINKNRGKGFTLIELVLVIVILGILAIVAIPAFNNLTPISLDAAARKVKEDLRYAQSLATTTGESHGFEVTANSTYRVYNVNTGTTVVSPYHHTPMTEDLSSEFGGAQFNSLTYQIEFNASGQPTTGGGTTVQINDGTNFKQIQITLTSGYIRLL